MKVNTPQGACEDGARESCRLLPGVPMRQCPSVLKPRCARVRYWILTNELADEDLDADLCGTFSTEPGDIDFDDGEAVPLPVEGTCTLTGRPRGNWTDHLGVGEVPGLVFSGRLCRLLQGMAIPNLQYFPLHIAGAPDGAMEDGYRIANVIGVVDCIDREASDLEYFRDGDIEFINSLVLDEGRIPAGLDIFRLAGRPTLVVVSEALKEAIVGAGMTGFAFRRPEDYG